MPRSAPTPRCERKPGANPASANRREPGNNTSETLTFVPSTEYLTMISAKTFLSDS